MPTNYLTRLEPRARSAGLEQGVAARVYDPLWLLARQWQMGELRGEDAGTPIGITLAAESADLAWWRAAGQRRFAAYDVNRQPLETLVEAQPLRATAWTARMRVDTGREFATLLGEAGAEAY